MLGEYTEVQRTEKLYYAIVAFACSTCSSLSFYYYCNYWLLLLL